VGDSRLYHFRAGVQLDRTLDHTRVAQMVSHGLLSPEEARHHPDAHVLALALGGTTGVQRGFKPEVWMEPLQLQQGDVVLLCSDGLYDLIEDAELYPLIEGCDYQDAVERLIRVANERGGADNITVILLVAGQPEVPSAAVSRPAGGRRETLPEGMAAVPVDPVPMAPASVPPQAEPPPPAAPRADAPMQEEGSARRVPLWWVPVAAALALGVGFLLGWALRGSGAPEVAVTQGAAVVPLPPAPEAPELPGPASSPAEDAGVAQAAPLDAGSSPPASEARGK
jgi:hypothetical protein